MKTKFSLALLVLLPTFSWLSGEAWPVIYRFPIETNFMKLPEVEVSRKSYSNYYSLLLPLYLATMPVTTAAFNRDMGKAILISPDVITKVGSLVFFDRDAGILQRFPGLVFPVDWAVLTEKADRLVFASERLGQEKKIYTVAFSNYALDPNPNYQLMVDRVGRADWPSITPSGSRIAFQSDHDRRRTRIYVGDIDPSGRISNEFVVEGTGANGYRPRISATGLKLVYIQQAASSHQLIYADLQAKICYPIWNEMRMEGSVDLSADGEQIVFEAGRENQGDIFLVNFKKSVIWNLSRRDSALYGDPSELNSENSDCAMSEDGSVIAYQCRGRWDVSAVKVIDFRAKKTWHIRDAFENKGHPFLSKDGNTLVFLVDKKRPYVVDLKRLREPGS
ncbi:MAG: PD40 domain-containing protein [Spirochaetes bacterium]|nr:PD40 domain-containing protein [Spirochaetota bacterium]